jgi:hypothetical protein
MTPRVGAAPRVASAAALRRGYEDLRRGVLAPGDGSRSLGEGLLVSGGMAAWMRAWVDVAPSRESPPREACDREGVLPAAGRGEMVSVLAHMALGAR